MLDYIRTSIEIIMNLKVEDLEKEFEQKNSLKDNLKEERSSSELLQEIQQISVSSSNLIQQSMKDALLSMVEQMDSARSTAGCSKCGANEIKESGPPKKYEKIIQKLESDVRGHIRVSLDSIID